MIHTSGDSHLWWPEPGTFLEIVLIADGENALLTHHGENQKKKRFPRKWVHGAVYAD